MELDFEPSSAAEWSFSMATPTDRLTVQETPVSVANSTSTEEEEEYECPTTNESVLELRKVLHGGSAKANRKLPLRKILANGNKVQSLKGVKCEWNDSNYNLFVSF